MIRWVRTRPGRVEAKVEGLSLEVFATGLGDWAWQVFDPKANDPFVSLAAGDAGSNADAKWWAERSAREIRAKAIIASMGGPEEAGRQIREELVRTA